MIRPSAKTVRVSSCPHPRHNELAECLCWPVNGARLVRYRDGVVEVLEAHEWEEA
ncbi:MAG: hypothetical protein M3P49_09565 [Actinomycetota bacterium]|nr:hypothetical protein [Actinomycetota bacterium]